MKQKQAETQIPAKEYFGTNFTGERSLFAAQNTSLFGCSFRDGESPLKESANITLKDCTFGWKYPLWFAKHITATDSFWESGARAGVWYSQKIHLQNCRIEAPKNFRRCQDLTLQNVEISNAEETLWACDGVEIKNITAKGAYFAMNSKNMKIEGLELVGDYPFDGAENVEIRNSRLISKDAFWNSKSITVYDSYIEGEYLGWCAENLTLINCTVESLQGLCYIKNLTMRNCKLQNTTLAFEYSTVDAEIDGGIKSVFNPKEGRIIADRIDELILQEDKIDPAKTHIMCRGE